MIKFKLPKKRDIRVFEEVYPRQAAQIKADASKDGVIGGITRVFSNKNSDWRLSEYFLRYEPFWHIIGESFFEYMRRAQYQVGVRPEVRSVKINRSVVPVDDSKPVITVAGDEHCFEKYAEDVSIKAWEKGKDRNALKPYMKSKAMPVNDLDELAKSDTDLIPVETRASFLLSETLKSLIKPIQADKVIKSIVEVKQLTLYFRPVHVFNYTNSDGKAKTVTVDAVTGEVSKPNVMLQRLKGVRPTEDMYYDAGAGIVDSLLPGAGIGVFIGKYLMGRRRQKKIKSAMESSKKAAAESGQK